MRGLFLVSVWCFLKSILKQYGVVFILLGFAFSCAILFYIGVFFAVQVWQFFVLQGVNAIFYGIFAGIGQTILQEQLPSRIGFNSAFMAMPLK